MTMTVNESVDTLSPFAGPVSPILFGIEHEYNLPPYDGDCGCDADAYECECVSYDDFEAPDLPPGWEQLREHCGWEVRTPPTHNIGEVMDVFRRLSRHFQWGHNDCGYHIHLNADPANGPAVNLAVFAQNWLIHRDTLYRHCPWPDSGGDRDAYAASISDDVMEWMSDAERYQELNWTSLNAHTTLEIRLAAATPNMERFELWLRYVLAVATMSLLSADPLADYGGLVGPGNGWSHRFNAAGTHLRRIGLSKATVLSMSEAITREA